MAPEQSRRPPICASASRTAPSSPFPVCRRVVQMQLRDSGQLTRLITDGGSCCWTGALGSQKHVGFRCLTDELSEMRAKSPQRSPVSRQLLMIPYCLPLSSLLCVDPAAICSARCAPAAPNTGPQARERDRSRRSADQVRTNSL
jgi:hypothetical protein